MVDDPTQSDDRIRFIANSCRVPVFPLIFRVLAELDKGLRVGWRGERSRVNWQPTGYIKESRHRVESFGREWRMHGMFRNLLSFFLFFFSRAKSFNSLQRRVEGGHGPLDRKQFSLRNVRVEVVNRRKCVIVESRYLLWREIIERFLLDFLIKRNGINRYSKTSRTWTERQAYKKNIVR